MAGGGGGGFLLGADDVVQAFRLPKYQHTNLAELPTPSAITNSDGDAPFTEDSSREPLKDFTYDLHTMDMDSDVDMEEISTIPALQETAPKTMQEMAEDAARLQIDDVSDDEVIDTDVYRPSPPPRAPGDGPRLTITVPPRARGETSSALKSSTPTKQPPRARPSRRSSAKKRRRDDEESLPSLDETQSPSKRRVRSKPVLPAPTVVPTRTLRPRTSKSAAQIDEEKELENAYRRATAK